MDYNDICVQLQNLVASVSISVVPSDKHNAREILNKDIVGFHHLLGCSQKNAIRVDRTSFILSSSSSVIFSSSKYTGCSPGRCIANC